jgi:hypothetical protein
MRKQTIMATEEGRLCRPTMRKQTTKATEEGTALYRLTYTVQVHSTAGQA